MHSACSRVFKGKVNPDSDFKHILRSVDHEKLPKDSGGNEAQRKSQKMYATG